MKNLLFGLVAFVMLSVNLNAQNHSSSVQDFGKGQTYIQVGYGIISTSSMLDNATSKLPPLSIRIERFMGENFTLGLAYTMSSHQGEPIIVGDGFSQRVTNTTQQIALRPAFHFTNIKKADLYGGFQLGVSFEKFEVDRGDFDFLENHLGIHPQNTKVAYSAFVGGRYAINNRWSTFGEIGFGAALVSAGIGFRI